MNSSKKLIDELKARPKSNIPLPKPNEYIRPSQVVFTPEGINPYPQPRADRCKTHYIYIMILTDPTTETLLYVKVGHTMDLEYRISSIDHHSDYDAQYVYFKSCSFSDVEFLEKEIHSKFPRVSIHEVRREIRDGFSEIHSKDNLLTIYDYLVRKVGDTGECPIEPLRPHRRFEHNNRTQTQKQIDVSYKEYKTKYELWKLNDAKKPSNQ